MQRHPRLGKDPLGDIAEFLPGDDQTPESGSRGIETLDRIISGAAPTRTRQPRPPQGPAGMAARETDAGERARAFLDDLIDGAEIVLSRRPELLVEMESDLADLSMQNAYLLGHSLKILLGLGAGPSGRTRSDAVLRIRLTSLLSGRVALSVTDDGAFFCEDIDVLDASDRDMRELVAFVTGRGGSVLVTRLAVTEVAVVIWNRAAVGFSPRVNA